MQKNNMIIAAVVVVVLIVAAAFSWQYLGSDDSDDSKVTFLVQDDQGVYFWMEGSGDTAYDALKDAVDNLGIAFEPSVNSSGEAYGIQSLFGLEMYQEGDVWFYWAQYVWTGSAWDYAQTGMNGYSPAEANNYVALVYGDGNATALCEPKDAVVWDGSTAGTVFTIESSSGMYFKVNGTGTTVYDAFADAVADYAIPFEPSVNSSGEAYGIQSLFGLEMTQDAAENWHWWGQYCKENGEWVSSQSYMTGLQSSENPEFKVAYQ